MARKLGQLSCRLLNVAIWMPCSLKMCPEPVEGLQVDTGRSLDKKTVKETILLGFAPISINGLDKK